MRHTLLPLNERKTLRKDYYMRLFTVFLFLVSGAGLVGIGSLFPAYIHARNLEKDEMASANSVNTGEDAKNRANIENNLKASTKLVNRLGEDLGKYRPSTAIESLIDLRGKVALTSFIVNQISTSTVKITIEGRALSRNDLLGFQSRIENTLKDAKVDLPLSELAKSKDIDFSMRINYKP